VNDLGAVEVEPLAIHQPDQLAVPSDLARRVGDGEKEKAIPLEGVGHARDGSEVAVQGDCSGQPGNHRLCLGDQRPVSEAQAIAGRLRGWRSPAPARSPEGGEMMFGLGSATKIYLAAGATDMRKGFDGLYGLVRQRLQADPLSGHLFLFCNRPRTRLKVFFWDGSGLWVCAKRLVKGCFSWPQDPSAEAKASINAEEFAMLLGGIDLSQTRRKTWWRAEPVGGEQK
jgi:transposase